MRDTPQRCRYCDEPPRWYQRRIDGASSIFGFGNEHWYCTRCAREYNVAGFPNTPQSGWECRPMDSDAEAEIEVWLAQHA